MNSKNIEVVCFGEILWDVFQDEKKPGGAPMNVAVHLNQLNVNSTLISRVGSDENGIGLSKFINPKLPVSYIQADKKYPTGLVNVKLSESRNATYDIVFPSAWDFIECSHELEKLVRASIYFVYGSLAARNGDSEKALKKLIQVANKRVFDLNFRPPHYSRAVIEELIYKADIVKFNTDELDVLRKWYCPESSSEKEVVKLISSKFSLQEIILTQGGDGAMIYADSCFYQNSGIQNIKVEDTVGSGDSFLAAYLSRLINGDSIESRLAFACATGAFVATKKGAIPQYHKEDIFNFLKTG